MLERRSKLVALAGHVVIAGCLVAALIERPRFPGSTEITDVKVLGESSRRIELEIAYTFTEGYELDPELVVDTLRSGEVLYRTNHQPEAVFRGRRKVWIGVYVGLKVPPRLDSWAFIRQLYNLQPPEFDSDGFKIQIRSKDGILAERIFLYRKHWGPVYRKHWFRSDRKRF